MNQSTLISDQPMKVLTSTLRDRLAQANQAKRVLLGMGYRVAKQDLRLGNDKQRPIVTLQKGDEALRATLKHVMNGVSDGARCVIGRLRDVDVDVCWPIETH